MGFVALKQSWVEIWHLIPISLTSAGEGKWAPGVALGATGPQQCQWQYSRGSPGDQWGRGASCEQLMANRNEPGFWLHATNPLVLSNLAARGNNVQRRGVAVGSGRACGLDGVLKSV